MRGRNKFAGRTGENPDLLVEKNVRCERGGGVRPFLVRVAGGDGSGGCTRRNQIGI